MQHQHQQAPALCAGIDYGQWNLVSGSTATGSYSEYYAFGNPQPTFDPTTHALTNLAVQVVGAAHDPNTATNYIFDSETINLAAANGFLTNVWWSNYESYNPAGDYSACNYNWKIGYNINNSSAPCNPVYFGPNDYIFGPVYTNDSIFVSGPTGDADRLTVVRQCRCHPAVPTSVTTADPNCLFVDDNRRDVRERRQLRQLPTTTSSSTTTPPAPTATGRVAATERRPARPHRQPVRLPLLRTDPDHPEHGRRRSADVGRQPGHPEQR